LAIFFNTRTLLKSVYLSRKVKIMEAIRNGYPQTSFKGLQADTKGVIKLCSYGLSENLQEAVELAENSTDNKLIIDKDGGIELENEKYGRFSTYNPPRAEQKGQYFYCDIRKANNTKERLELKMPDEEMARNINEEFGPGTFIPRSKLELFKAMVAASQYEKEQAKIEEYNKD